MAQEQGIPSNPLLAGAVVGIAVGLSFGFHEATKYSNGSLSYWLSHNMGDALLWALAGGSAVGCGLAYIWQSTSR